MKKLALLFCVLFVSVFALWQSSNKKNRYINVEEEDTEDEDDYNEFVPGITGPRGERVFIGAGGGRYYTKDSSNMYAGFNQ